MDMQELLLGELKKKYWLVLVCMVLFSLALSVEKMYFTEVVYTPTSAYVQKTVSMSYKELPAAGETINCKNVLASNGMYLEFISSTADKYEYGKIVRGWQDLPADKKVVWLQKHFTLSNVASDLCIYAFYLPAEEVADAVYMKENADRFVTDYIEFSQREAGKYLHTSGYNIEASSEILSEQKVVSSKKRILKYAVIGLVLGAMVGTLLVFGTALRKREHV